MQPNATAGGIPPEDRAPDLVGPGSETAHAQRPHAGTGGGVAGRGAADHDGDAVVAEPDGDDGSAVADESALDVLVRRTRRPQTEPEHRWRDRIGDLVPHAVPRGPALAALVVAALVGFFGWHFVARPAPIEDRMPVATADSASSSAAPTGGDAEVPPGSVVPGKSGGGGDPKTTVTVHVAGAVQEPGLVSIPDGARVADAAIAAGGLLPTADLDRVNLAAPVVDGSRIFLPTVGQQVPPELPVAPVSGGGEPSDVAPLDINSADADALEALPGVGPATAAAIIEHREENGRFDSPESLLDVRGIGDAKLDAIRDLVTVG